jgi:Tfp pilus assembly protein FimT
LKIGLKNSKSPSDGAFSLVELLLTLVLILCLAAASVFTFTAIYRTANLDEGFDRFQSLIRFAQAEAATTGRKVRLEFAPAVSKDGDEKSDLRNIKITWEADLLNAPGVFQDYTNKAWSEDIVNELVGVERVQSADNFGQLASPGATADSDPLAINSDPLADPSTVNPVSSSTSTLASTDPSATSPVSRADQTTNDFPSITFYPDGSCDSAEIVLASRNTEDERRVEVKLSGILGSVSKRTISSSDPSEIDEEEMDYLAGEDGGETGASTSTLSSTAGSAPRDPFQE